MFVGGGAAWGQQNVFSRDNSGTGLWWSDSNNPWYYQTWNSISNRPDQPFVDNQFTRNDVFIGHNNNTTMTVNGAFFGLRTLTIQSSVSSARTYNASDSGGISLTVGYTNEGSANQTFNVPIGVDASNVQFSVAGGITTFSQNFFLNSNTATFTGAGSIDISGTASGSGGNITKTGSGTLTLGGTNTYTGATAVNQGKLVVGGSIGSSAVTVSNAGTILASGTTGTIGNSVVVGNGAILAPGDAGVAGTATVSSATTFNNGSIFSWDIDAAATSYDKLVSTTGLVDGDGAGGAVLRIVASDALVTQNFWNTTKTWTDIFTTNGTNAIANWADIFTSVTVVNSSFATITPGGGSFSASGNTLTWQPALIPEPTTALAGLLLAAGMLRRKR